MGAGKTTFIKELCHQMGVSDIVQSLLGDAVFAVPAGAAISLVTPFDWWRVGVAVFGGYIIFRLCVTFAARSR